MPNDYSAQGIAYMGVKNGKFAVADSVGEYGSPVALKYLKTVPLNTAIDSTAIYSDDKLQKNIRTDNGYTGNIGISAPDAVFEKALGYAMDGDSGLMQVSGTGYKKVAFYFEHSVEATFGTYVVKCWLLNCEVDKASRSHDSNTNTPNIGEYQYPITVKGETVMDAAGTAIYVDSDGNEQICTLYTSVPSDEDFDTFGATVPTPKIKTVTP